MKNNYIVPSIDRAIKILKILASSKNGLSLNELTFKSSLPKTSVFRILTTLEASNLVERDSDGRKYSLGLKLFELGSAKLNRVDLYSVSFSYLERLAQESGETTCLGVLNESEVIYLAEVEGPANIRANPIAGRRAPAHCTATGQILLAYLPEEEVDKIIQRKGLFPYTSKTITDREEFKKRLNLAKSQGIALAIGEHHDDVFCVAAPIRNNQGKVVASITIYGPIMRTHGSLENRIDKLVKSVKQVAYDISRELGYNF